MTLSLEFNRVNAFDLGFSTRSTCMMRQKMVRAPLLVGTFLDTIGSIFLDDAVEHEPCNAGCRNGGQCFLSSFCICPKSVSSRKASPFELKSF